MANLILKWIPASALVFLLTAPQALAAGSKAAEAIQKGLTDTNATAGFGTDPLPTLIGKVIQSLLGVVGLIFLVLTIYAGILYMMAEGDTTKVTKAKGILTQALIGLIIIVGAYALTNFVVTELTKATAAT